MGRVSSTCLLGTRIEHTCDHGLLYINGLPEELESVGASILGLERTAGVAELRASRFLDDAGHFE